MVDRPPPLLNIILTIKIYLISNTIAKIIIPLHHHSILYLIGLTITGLCCLVVDCQLPLRDTINIIIYHQHHITIVALYIMSSPDRYPHKCSICLREFPSYRSKAIHFGWCNKPNMEASRSKRKKSWKRRIQEEARKGRQHAIKINKRTYYSEFHFTYPTKEPPSPLPPEILQAFDVPADSENSDSERGSDSEDKR